MEREDLFGDRMRAADEAIRKRRGIPAGKVNGTRIMQSDGVKIKISSDVVEIGGVEVPTTSYMNDFQEHLEGKFTGLIKNLPQIQMNKTLTIVTQLGDKLGEIKGLRHKQTEDLLKCMNIRGRDGHRKNISITGAMGGGKSVAVKQCADAMGIDFRYTGMSEMKSDVLGSVHPISKEYMPSEFVKAYTLGGAYVAEEMDGWSPRATLSFNVPLANGILTTPDGVTHERHPDCIIIACMNTYGRGATTEYVGRNKLDAAFLDRFSPRLDWEYDADLERAIANHDEVVEAVQLCRLNAENNRMKVIISPRSSINCADMVRAGYSLREAFERDFLIGLDRAQVRTLLEGVF